MATCKECFHYVPCFIGGKSIWDNIEQTKDDHCKYFVPAADVAEVVRCKNCIHCERGICYYPKVRYVSHDKNHFCGYGEKKGGAE